MPFFHFRILIFAVIPMPDTRRFPAPTASAADRLIAQKYFFPSRRRFHEAVISRGFHAFFRPFFLACRQRHAAFAAAGAARRCHPPIQREQRHAMAPMPPRYFPLMKNMKREGADRRGKADRLCFAVCRYKDSLLFFSSLNRREIAMLSLLLFISLSLSSICLFTGQRDRYAHI